MNSWRIAASCGFCSFVSFVLIGLFSEMLVFLSRNYRPIAASAAFTLAMSTCGGASTSILRRLFVQKEYAVDAAGVLSAVNDLIFGMFVLVLVGKFIVSPAA